MEQQKTNKTQIILQNLLKETRFQKGLSQQDLAKQTGFTQSAISKYEAGERQLSVLELIKICNALEIELSSFATELQTRIKAL